MLIYIKAISKSVKKWLRIIRLGHLLPRPLAFLSGGRWVGFLKLRAWAIAILSFLEKVSVFSFASLKLCMVTLLRYGYLVDTS